MPSAPRHTPRQAPRPPQASAFAEHCAELLSPLGSVRAKRMFGGHGLYVDDLFIGLLLNDQLYLKTDDQTRARFIDAGCEPFRYERGGADGAVTTAQLNFYQPPEEALESAALMHAWGRLAMEAALRAANAKALKAAHAAKAPARKKAAGSGRAKRPAEAASSGTSERPGASSARTAQPLKRSPGAGRKKPG